MEPETKPRPNRDVHGSNGSDGGHNNGGNGSNNSGNNRNNNRHSLSCPLTREESYQNDHLTHAAFVSIAILTFITFVGNFTQLQLSAALPTIVSDFGISVTTGQWLTSIFQLVMGVMVPLTAYLTRRFSTRQIVIASMAVFTLGSVFAWLGSSFVLVLIGRLLEAVGTGVMWPVLQITVFSIYPLSAPWYGDGHRRHGHERRARDRPHVGWCANRFERLAIDLPHADGYRRDFTVFGDFRLA